MDSMPPATASSYSPARMALDASMTARIPEPQTLCSVMQGTLTGIPAPRAAWRAGAWPMPAWRTLPRMTCSTDDASTPARSRAPRIAMDPSAGADREDSFPRKDPTGVRAAERMTVFFMALPILTPALLPCSDADSGGGLRGEADRARDFGRDRNAGDAAQDALSPGGLQGCGGDPPVLRRRGHRADPA